MDSSQEEFAQLQSCLGAAARHLVDPRQLQEHIGASRTEFTAWIDRNLVGSEAIPLLLTPLTRNPFHTFFYGAVMLRIAAEVLAGEAGDLLVVTRSSGLMRVLKDHAGLHDLKWDCVGSMQFRITMLHAGLWSMLKFARDIVHSIIRTILARWMLGQAHLDRARNVDVLVDTFLFPRDVLADGTVRHRYYPGLIDWYQASGYTPAYYPLPFQMPLRDLPALYRGYRASSYIFLPLELLCDVSDVVAVAFACVVQVAYPKPLRDESLWGIRIGALAASGRFRMALDGLFPLLLLRAPQRMAQHGIRPRWMLDWFENQPLDQATTIGFRRYQPDCRVIALRLYAQYSSNLLSYQVTNREVDDGVVPSEHWMCGDAWLSSAKSFDSRSDYRLVPGLRYAYLQGIVPPKVEGGDLLILLTHSLPESTRILAVVGAALPALKRWFSSILVKPHPALGVRRLERSLARNHPGLFDGNFVRWTDDSMVRVLPRARLAVSAGSSSILEAVSQGIPALVVGAGVGIDMCPLEFVDRRIWRIVYDGTELERAIAEWSPCHPLSREERLAIGRITRIRCFEPVSGSSMERFSLD